jgi:undecaprenyl-diphosphatase
MRQADGALPLEHAVVLGLLHGPAELLPVSSSAHTTLVPWLLGWPYPQLDDDLRKAFEVALHAGAGAALAIALREQLGDALEQLNGPRASVLALALAPATLTGYLLGDTIERRLGGPRSIAVGLLGGAVAMAAADARAGRRGGTQRTGGEARAGDGLALGLAQACALMPGVSRNGATLSAARARGFDRTAAQRLSWEAGLPVILGACLLKGLRLRRARIHREHGAALAAGATAAFLSTLASAQLLRRGTRDGRSLLPYALYRCLLAALVIVRMRAQ